MNKKSAFLATQMAVLAMTMSLTATAADDEMNMHQHHHHHDMSMETHRSEPRITLPDVQVVRQDGKKVKLKEELGDGRVVVVNFIFTTCSAICPMTSKTFEKLQEKLGDKAAQVHLVSISIDPEQDSPEKLLEFAKKYNAGSSWDFYTGTEAASIKIQKAMNAFRGDKMNHAPATFIKNVRSGGWIRLDGFATSEQLMTEVTSALPQN